MLDIEGILRREYPKFFRYPSVVTNPLIAFLRLVLHERAINEFLAKHKHDRGLTFIDAVLDELNISYKTDSQQIQNIPVQGKCVVVANHPLGALDALAMIKMISTVRQDGKIRIVANQILSRIEQLDSLIIPVDNMSGKLTKESMRQIQSSLDNEEMVIFFPAGEVSRAYLFRVLDNRWKSGFIKFAQRTNSPILPIYIKATNSPLFYFSSWIYRPLATFLLSNEMFLARNSVLDFRIGELISAQTMTDMHADHKRHARLMRKHLYRMARRKRGIYPTQQCIAHPEPRHLIKAELKNATLIGTTGDNKQIYLVEHEFAPSLLNEIGRLREYSFRKVGEGSGQKRDLDRYDEYYQHLVLWDDEALEVVGAYRIGECGWILSSEGKEGLYLNELCIMSDTFEGYLEHAIELGRSFIQPKYWGSRALDYLWHGIGAYLKHNPQVRYMIGPVSISGTYPESAKDALVYFYQHYFGDDQHLVQARTPYHPSSFAIEENSERFNGDNYREDFRALKSYLNAFNVTVPTLYKQYSELCEEGGIRFMDFGIDADFNNCIDSYILVDVTLIKQSKRERYIGKEGIEIV